MKKIPNKVLVTGAGRCGTSAFMKFLWGYIDKNKFLSNQYVRHNPKDYSGTTVIGNLTNQWMNHNNAGLEYIVEKSMSQKEIDGAPYIFKDPRICVNLEWFCKNKIFSIEHVFVLIRDYRKSAKSRQHYNMWWMEYGPIRVKNPNKSMLQNQIEFNQRMIGKLMETIAMYDIPHTVLHFPRFIEDKEYLFNKLQNTPLQISEEQIESAFAVFDKKQVNF